MRLVDYSKISISYVYKSKAKVVPVHRHSRGITPLNLISALDGGERTTSIHVRLTAMKEPPYSLNKRLSEPKG